jgi:hypothetical protein
MHFRSDENRYVQCIHFCYGGERLENSLLTESLTWVPLPTMHTLLNALYIPVITPYCYLVRYMVTIPDLLEHQKDTKTINTLFRRYHIPRWWPERVMTRKYDILYVELLGGEEIMNMETDLRNLKVCTVKL